MAVVVGRLDDQESGQASLRNGSWILMAPPLSSRRMETGGRHLCARSQASSLGASCNRAGITHRST